MTTILGDANLALCSSHMQENRGLQPTAPAVLLADDKTNPPALSEVTFRVHPLRPQMAPRELSLPSPEQIAESWANQLNGGC